MVMTDVDIKVCIPAFVGWNLLKGCLSTVKTPSVPGWPMGHFKITSKRYVWKRWSGWSMRQAHYKL